MNFWATTSWTKNLGWFAMFNVFEDVADTICLFHKQTFTLALRTAGLL